MMQGLDASFDGVVFIGYHASTTNPNGVRAHSFSSANLADVRVNGTSFSEGAWNAALAAHYGVPVLAVSGDEAAVAEVRALVPGVEGAVVKWPYAFHSARTLSPTASRAAIAEAVRKGMARRGATNLPRLATPIRLEIRFKSYRPAEVLSWLPGAERADAHTVRYTVKDMPEGSRFLAVVLNYQADLSP
jgi:D-amino peptidase